METKTLFKKIGRIPRIYRVLGIVFINVLIVSGLFTVIVKPKLEIEKKLTTEFRDLEKKLQNMTEIGKNIEKFRKEYSELKVAFEEIMRQLPETKDVPNILRRVSNLCAEAKIKVNYFEPKPPKQKEFYEEFPFEMKFSGPYHNIGYFFDGIRREERIIHVVSFSLEAKGSASQALSLEGSCTAQTYVYTAQREREGKKVETLKKQ